MTKYTSAQDVHNLQGLTDFAPSQKDVKGGTQNTRIFEGNSFLGRPMRRLFNRGVMPSMNDGAGSGRVNTNGGHLNMRAEPSFSARIIMTIPNGERVVVLGREGEFYSIAYAGKRGFVAREFVEVERGVSSVRPISSAQPRENVTDTELETGVVGVVYTGGGNLNVRALPSSEARVVSVVPNRAEILVFGRTALDWYKMEYGDIKGYVYGEYVALDPSVNVPFIM